MPNRLAAESSLYLRQHANNPVDWFPWGPEALETARQLGKPIFLSIGYSACHWCHVMEHESFEDAKTAAIMNEHFVCIKVDREERPDLDQIYMTSHHLLNRGEGGGWPLSVFLTPELTPFYAGTYYPPDERYAPQRPSFPRLLQAVAHHWETKRVEVRELGTNVAEHLQGLASLERNDSPLSLDLVLNAEASLKRAFDRTNGGFGHAPKFPHPMELRLLLRIAARTGLQATSALDLVTITLDRMARGGIYDQIGGGFHRYSVDAVWLVPHFEKMLYDNALLAPVYADAYRLTGNPFFKQIAIGTLDWVLNEMTHAQGGIFSTLDADSEGQEGKFYVWSEAELDAILTVEEARITKAMYSTSEAGNFEGHNLFFRWRSDEDDAQAQRLSVDEFKRRLATIKAKLYEVRAKRIRPGRDEKILTAWNGLMISALAQCGVALEQPKFIAAAVKATEFILANLRDAEGRLLRTWGEGVGAKLRGYLEDDADMLDALVSVYEATFDPNILDEATKLAELMIRNFHDDSGGFFFTASDHEALMARTKDLQDGSVPSGNAMAATALLRLAKLTGRQDFQTIAQGTLQAYRSLLGENPMSAGQMLNALDFFIGPVEEIAIIGHADAAVTTDVFRRIRGAYLPNTVMAFHDPRTGHATVELLKNKTMIAGQPTVFICRDFSCQAPLVGLEAVEAWLATRTQTSAQANG